MAALKAAAAQRLAAGQAQLDLGLAERSAAEPLPITSSKSALLWEALCAAYDKVGFATSPMGMRRFVSWCWPGSSNRPARPIHFGRRGDWGPVSYPTLKPSAGVRQTRFP
ncbi:putative transposase domain protein, partial [Mycobacterium avium MAV_120809_2495]